MKQVRRGVFETNSSSTHSICITDSDALAPLPFSVKFTCGEFGWEWETLRDIHEKASYLYSSMLALYTNEELMAAKEKIARYLAEADITCEFEEPVKNQEYGYYENASVDHAGMDEHRQFVDDTINDKGQLFRYLFNDESFVLTGNDNEYSDVDVDVEYPHKEYYKGN